MLIKALKTPKKAIFRHFLRANNENLVSEIFFKDLMYAIWMQNMLKPIRAINHTDSWVIWTRICQDIADFGNRLCNPPPPKKIPSCWWIFLANADNIIMVDFSWKYAFKSSSAHERIFCWKLIFQNFAPMKDYFSSEKQWNIW